MFRSRLDKKWEHIYLTEVDTIFMQVRRVDELLLAAKKPVWKPFLLWCLWSSFMWKIEYDWFDL